MAFCLPSVEQLSVSVFPVDFLLDSSFAIQAESFALSFQYDCLVRRPLLYSFDSQTIKGLVWRFGRTEKQTLLCVENCNNDRSGPHVQHEKLYLSSQNGDYLKIETRDPD